MPPRKKKIDYSSVADILVPYRRASTREQGERGTSLEGQQILCGAYMLNHKFRELNWDCTDIESGSKAVRAGLEKALAHVRAGEAGGIIVSKQDRLSRGDSVDFGMLLRAATREGWNIVCVDLGGFDLRTPIGRLISTIVGAVSHYELEVIRQRTREALAVNKANGKRHARPSVVDPALLEWILTEFEAEPNYSKIARTLMDSGVPTPLGYKTWFPGSIRNLIRSQDGQTMLRELEKRTA